MKKMMTAVMALLLMAGTSAFAQENKSVAPPRERPTTEQLARKATDRMTAQLKLTEKQPNRPMRLRSNDCKRMKRCVSRRVQPK